MTSRARWLAWLAAPLLACGGGTTATDASLSDAAIVVDAPADAEIVRRIVWRSGPELPTPLAFGTAQIANVDGQEYLYVIGGSSADRASLGTLSSAVFRSAISASDGALAPWESIGDILIGTTPRPLVGHASLHISDAMGNQGFAIAGGGSTTSALPIVLAVYVDATGELFDWSRFPPTLTAAQSFGTFDSFEPYELALVGGLTGTAFTDSVRIAAIDNGSTSMEWRVGPTLPAPRARHASFKFANRVYLFGGENLDGPVASVLRTTRDAAGVIDGWETVGTIEGAPLSMGALSYRRSAWLLGGIEGGSFDGEATARVRRAPLADDGSVGAFVDEEPLPMPLASSAMATTGSFVFLVGGQSGPDLAAVSGVLIGSLE